MDPLDTIATTLTQAHEAATALAQERPQSGPALALRGRIAAAQEMLEAVKLEAAHSA